MTKTPQDVCPVCNGEGDLEEEGFTWRQICRNCRGSGKVKP